MSDRVELKDFFRFTRDGKMKSGTIAYSVSLAALFLIIYAAAYYYLIDVLALVTAGLPIWASDLVGAVVPGVIGSLLCLIPILLLQDKKLALYAYRCIAGFAVVFLIAMALLLKDDKDALLLFIRLFLIMVPVPLVTGICLTKYLSKKQDAK